MDFYGSSATELKRKGKQLLQAANDNEPEQLFARPTEPAPEGAPLGANFERALYAAYLGGDWKITDGFGNGALLTLLLGASLERGEHERGLKLLLPPLRLTTSLPSTIL